jgi:hypothetical protein
LANLNTEARQLFGNAGDSNGIQFKLKRLKSRLLRRKTSLENCGSFSTIELPNCVGCRDMKLHVFPNPNTECVFGNINVLKLNQE